MANDFDKPKPDLLKLGRTGSDAVICGACAFCAIGYDN